MYAVVKAGGKQHKVAVGDVVEVNRLEGETGDEISLPALLLVDGRNVVSETAALAKIAVTGEIVGHHKGPKIKILKYKNKTGYRRRIGHRQLLTELLVTDIDDGKPKKAAKADTAKAEADDKPSKAAKAAPVKAEADDKPSKAAKAAPVKAEADDKPSKSAKAAKAAPVKAATDDKPSKTAKATSAKAADKPDKATKASKATKTSKAAASSKSSDTADEKKKD